MHAQVINAADQLAAITASKARFWDKIARKYARDPIADMAGYERTVQRVHALLSPEHEVLEIGCGTGSTALRLAPGVRSILATDVSTEMVAIAREKLAELALTQPIPQLDFRVVDADMPLPKTASWDAVLAFNLLHLATDLPQALRMAIDALKPGGLLISKTACVGEMNPLITRLAIPAMRALGKAPHVLCFRAEALEAALTQQGLEIVSVERHGSKRKDIRVFIVARKPNGHSPPAR